VIKFILTQELGRLAKWLRILGYDAEYSDSSNHSGFFLQALRDGRVILSRNHHLPKRTGLQIILINSEQVKQQVVEVVKTLKLQLNKDIMFSRCIICNTLLAPIEKNKIQSQVPDHVFKAQEHFITCPKCKRIYWQGTHWGNVTKTLEEIGVSF